MTQFFKRITGCLYVGLNRNRILEAIHSGPRSAWPFVQHVWSQALGVYCTRIGASARKPFELLILEEMVKARAECEEVFLENLLHPNSYVSAYCLLGLVRMDSQKIKTLPAELFEGQDSLIIHTGSFVSKQSLGDFAKKIVNRV